MTYPYLFSLEGAVDDLADIEGKAGEIYDQEIADLGTSANLNYANLLTLHQWAFEENKQVRLKNGFSHYFNITLTKKIFANEITTIILYNYLIFFIKQAILYSKKRGFYKTPLLRG